MRNTTMSDMDGINVFYASLVPEPATTGVVVLGVALIAARRQRA